MIVASRLDSLQDREVVPVYLHKTPEGVIVVMDGEGRMLGAQQTIEVRNGAQDITTATVTFEPEGWVE